MTDRNEDTTYALIGSILIFGAILIFAFWWFT